MGCKETLFDTYLALLHEELLPATGCTEPIAVAYAAAKARETLGLMPDSMEVRCSANIVKNVKSVTVPNTGGLRGIAAAAIAGVVGGNAQARLEVLQSISDADRIVIKTLLASKFCKATLADGIEGLYVDVLVRAGEHSAQVVLKYDHSNIILIRKDSVTLFEAADDAKAAHTLSSKYACLRVKDIVEFADTVDLSKVSDLLETQINYNTAIADEGLKHNYGASVGKTILAMAGASANDGAYKNGAYKNGACNDGSHTDIRLRARARAAAGSDARMSGCALPVVINSGSGNQGLTVSIPVIEYAATMKVSHETLLRALLVSNLVALEQKGYVGKLSAYCGAVSAAVGSGAGITYLCGGKYPQIADTITNAIATASGMLCDGAKSSCAAKISTAVESAIVAHEMSAAGRHFAPGDGLVAEDVEKTIRNFGMVAAIGMRPTDTQIIGIMLDE